MLKSKVYIIGISPDGALSLLPRAQKLVEKADIIIGAKRLLDLFLSLSAERITLGNNLLKITELIKKNLGDKQMAVLSSGDPNFYGIAGYLTDKLGKDAVEILPNVSSMQVAFARIKESWADAVFLSVHSRLIEDIVEKVRLNSKIGIFTDGKNTPSAIAKALIERGVSGYQAYVCQNLGEKEEKIVKTDLPGLLKKKFSKLNILILLKASPEKTDSPRAYTGIPDAEFHQRKPKDGLITKQEIRAVSLSKLHLTDESLLWDIGAGSGAVSIEASSIIHKGRIYTIEKNAADIAIIKKNIKKFNASNIEIIQALAPEGLRKLPAPTAVFIGGSGGKMKEIIITVSKRLKPGGRIVINTVALENLNIAFNTLKNIGFSVEVTLVNIARSTAVAELTRLEALNPVFVITGAKKED